MSAKAQTWLSACWRGPVVRPALITAAIGIVLVTFWPLENLSYDLGTWFKPATTITNAVVVYVDPETLKVLGTSADRNELSRTNYAQLLNLLAEDNARLVFMDILFTQPDSNPDVDKVLARAIRHQGAVVLAADLVPEPVPGAELETMVPPIGILARAAKGRYGHVKVNGNVAGIISAPWFSGYSAFTNSAVWVAATNLDPGLRHEDGNQERWLNYYGEPFIEAFPNCSLQNVLSTNFPRGFFAGRIVFVGQKLLNGDIATLNDTCGTPYSFFGAARSPGVVINAMQLLNLIRGDWLGRVARPWQWLGAVVWAFAIVGLLYSLSEKSKLILVLAAVFGAAALCVGSLYAQWHLHWFWSWIGPVCAQTPIALILVMRNPKPDRYVAFISYRRKEDGETALLIARSLADVRLKTFIDQQSLNAGKFDEQLLREIESATFFIPILSSHSLDRCAKEGRANDEDWVLRELTHALERRKKIVPVLKDGFAFDVPPPFPDLWQINELKSYHGVAYSNLDFDGFMEKLKALLGAA